MLMRRLGQVEVFERQVPNHSGTGRVGSLLGRLFEFAGEYVLGDQRVAAYAALDDLRGKPRNNAIGALQSLFGFAKKRGLVFTNPTTSVKANRIDSGLLPMSDGEIRAVERIATGPRTTARSPPWPPKMPPGTARLLNRAQLAADSGSRVPKCRGFPMKSLQSG